MTLLNTSQIMFRDEFFKNEVTILKQIIIAHGTKYISLLLKAPYFIFAKIMLTNSVI